MGDEAVERPVGAIADAIVIAREQGNPKPVGTEVRPFQLFAMGSDRSTLAN
jgi:hypothetical protein